MSITRRDLCARSAWIATAVVVLLYAPMALEFTARLFTDDAPRLWDHTFAGVVGERQALGPGSIHEVQHENYGQHRTVLLAHTTVGALAISLSVFQLSRRSRTKIAVHRQVGRVQCSLAVVSMIGAITYLLLVGPDGTFDGPAFYLQLWALAIGTLVATLLGWLAIRRGHLSSHRILMTYAFALLCTAPFLRVLYLLFGLAWPDSTQLVTNLAGASVLAVWAPMAAAFASRRVPVARRREQLTPLPGPALERGALVVSTIGAAALTVGYAAAFDGLDRITITAIVANALGIALTALNLREADDRTAREEWRIHHTAMLAGLPLTALLWLTYTVPFTTEQAFYGAILTGPAVALSAAVGLVAWRRRIPARRPAAAVTA
ncbi:DUF2306 domain-containing protein [Nocardioides sp. YIM B13467]|uniref:DUF2306 domain-containing protein n=1 Tax=Nocardioides sp. YIM B13467 TaxID=3366294 RepID=UPI00366C2601